MIGKHELRAGNFPEAVYQVTIRLLVTDADGDIGTEAVFTKRTSSDVLARIRVDGDGRTRGSWERRFTPAFIGAGNSLGRFVIRKLYSIFVWSDFEMDGSEFEANANLIVKNMI
jgi:hypothetical protein